MNTCRKCPALCASRSQIVYPTKARQGGIVCIGEAPGADEDETGEGFVGQAGKRLDQVLDDLGMKRGDQYGVANICRCRPEGNRKPTLNEISSCLPWLADYLAETRPRVILLVGGTASSVFLGKRPLFELIGREADSRSSLIRHAAPALQPVLLDLFEQGLGYMVPMPHTSPLAWHRKAPNGEKWSDIGKRQIRIAVAIFQSGKASDVQAA